MISACPCLAPRRAFRRRFPPSTALHVSRKVQHTGDYTIVVFLNDSALHPGAFGIRLCCGEFVYGHPGTAVESQQAALLPSEGYMPHIRLICPQCSKKLVVSDEKAGKRGRCPSCGAVIKIPGSARAPEAARDTGTADSAGESAAGLPSFERRPEVGPRAGQQGEPVTRRYGTEHGGMRLIVAGGRDYQFMADDKRKLDELHRERQITEVVSTGEMGADHCGEVWAKLRGIPVRVFQADWEACGKEAEHNRNRQMAEYADAVALFPGGDTDDLHLAAKSAGLTVFNFRSLRPASVERPISHATEDESAGAAESAGKSPAGPHPVERDPEVGPRAGQQGALGRHMAEKPHSRARDYEPEPDKWGAILIGLYYLLVIVSDLSADARLSLVGLGVLAVILWLVYQVAKVKPRRPKPCYTAAVTRSPIRKCP